MKKNSEFEEIVTMIGEAKRRAFQKVNEELVLLYFNFGGIVSKKVAAGVWGNNTVNDLSDYIKHRYNGLHGFSRPRLLDSANHQMEYSNAECRLLLSKVFKRNQPVYLF